LTLAGKDAATALPLVNDHLQRCANCHEEFEALLEAVKAMQV
jgi:predicted anti-sigma-YlaC factor YlaD